MSTSPLLKTVLAAISPKDRDLEIYELAMKTAAAQRQAGQVKQAAENYEKAYRLARAHKDDKRARRTAESMLIAYWQLGRTQEIEKIAQEVGWERWHCTVLEHRPEQSHDEPYSVIPKGKECVKEG